MIQTIAIYGVTFVVSVLLAAGPKQVEIVPSEDYSTRRFAEVVATALETENLTPQERLISLRAKLVIAERQLQDLQNRRETAKSPQEHEEAPKIVHLRAAMARVDHYKLKISELEKSILAGQKKSAPAPGKWKKR